MMKSQFASSLIDNKYSKVNVFYVYDSAIFTDTTGFDKNQLDRLIRAGRRKELKFLYVAM